MAAHEGSKLGIQMNSSSCVVVSRIHSAPTVDSFSPESCQPDHSAPGLDLVVSIVPWPASVSPPLTLNLIILHHDNYLLPLTFSLPRFVAVSQIIRFQNY